MRHVITSRLRACWRVSEKPVRVTIRFRLQKNGRLLGPPEILDQPITPEVRKSAEWAIHAIRACQPFKLPPERYEVWKTIVWEFDPTPISN
jgi:colicin import membrane protein